MVSANVCTNHVYPPRFLGRHCRPPHKIDSFATAAGGIESLPAVSRFLFCIVESRARNPEKRDVPMPRVLYVPAMFVRM
jgi:hypothetical protein